MKKHAIELCAMLGLPALASADPVLPLPEEDRQRLDMTYTYVGAYEVTVPAGRFNASLLKWDYKGEIGPASIEDVQYRFLAKGVGPTAVIRKLDLSAFLVYQNHTKYGMVLTEAVEKGAVRKLPAPRPETLRRRQTDPGSEP